MYECDNKIIALNLLNFYLLNVIVSFYNKFV